MVVQKYQTSIPNLSSWGEEEKLIAQYIKTVANNHPIKILEAGCGQKWDQVDLLHDVDYYLVGVDLDQKALERRKNVLKDLDEGIHGDLREINFPNETFDVIFSSFVLEHIDNANYVMESFVKWLKPGGIIILRIPDPQSVYGFASKMLPFFLHVWYVKYICGYENAGKEGNGPYPVVYDDVVSRKGIYRFCQSHTLDVKEELCDKYYHTMLESPYPFISKVSKLFSFLTFQYLKNHRNLLYILQS